MSRTVLVRYGAVPEVSRFHVATCEQVARGAAVVVQTRRGVELGTLLEPLPGLDEPEINGAREQDLQLIRPAGTDDQASYRIQRETCNAEFDAWTGRIRQWGLEIELIDLERTLDGTRLILYVLNGRNAETTRLALLAAAAGLGLVEVQPVSSEGLAVAEKPTGGGGCGSCGCH